MSGQDKGKGIDSLDIDKIEEEIINFADISETGTKLSTVLMEFK